MAQGLVHGVAPAAVLLRGHAALFLEGGGKIAVIRKPGLLADVQHPHASHRHELAGAVKADGVHIVLEGLVQGSLQEAGEIAHGTVLRRGEVRQADLLGVVFIHEADEAGESGVAFVDVGLLLHGHAVAGQQGEDLPEEQRSLPGALQLKEGRPLQIAAQHLRQRPAEAPAALLPAGGVQVKALRGDAAEARVDLFKNLGRELKAQEGGALPHAAEFVESARGKEEQVSLLRHGPLRSQPDGEPALGDPDQLPLLVEVGRAVVHGIKKDADPVDLAVTDDLQFFHAAPPFSSIVADTKARGKCFLTPPGNPLPSG